MTYESPSIVTDRSSLSGLPAWVTSRLGESAQNVAFLSGASFAMLDLALRASSDHVPKRLLANTLALKAAVATSKLEGRMAREQDIRDAYHLAPAGDALGPDGDMLAFWRAAVRLSLRGPGWIGKVAAQADDHLRDDVPHWIAESVDAANRNGPLAAASGVIETVIRADDRAERLACYLADIVLAQSMAWEHPLPLTALHLNKGSLRDLRDGNPESDTDVQRAITKSAQIVYQLALTLARRAELLNSIAPKLRARGSDEAVSLFLREDAVAPSGMLSPRVQGTNTPMTSRAARRLCDRLVELGAVKELTGRSTFRLYGVAP